MRLKKLKTEAAALAAISADRAGRPLVEFMTKDSSVVGIRIGTLHVAKGDYSGLEVLREANLEEARRYRVTATAQGFTPQTTYHEDYTEATVKRDGFGEGVTVEMTDNVPVLVDAAGNVVREGTLDSEPEGKADDDLPF